MSYARRVVSTTLRVEKSALPLVPRLGSVPSSKVLRVGDLVLNLASYDASRAGKEITMSETEFRLLETLMRRHGRIVSRNALVHSVWNSNHQVDNNVIDITIYQLRKKVDRHHKVKLIETVRSLGFTIREPRNVR